MSTDRALVDRSAASYFLFGFDTHSFLYSRVIGRLREATYICSSFHISRLYLLASAYLANQLRNLQFVSWGIVSWGVVSRQFEVAAAEYVRSCWDKALRMAFLEFDDLLHGSQIDVIDGSSKTPLCLTSEDGYAGVVEVLLKNGADMDSRHPEYAQAPLSLASEGEHEDVARLLLAQGAKVDATDSQGRAARDRAIDEGHDEIVKLLETYQGEQISLAYA
ncbi:ankyrin repeat-containing domain protein [Fusarium oxysporum]|nr:ankyrin repeat-containing domain protein [Fusarium oxysporum]